MFVDLWVKRDLYMGLGLCRGRVENDDMDLLKVFEQSVQVVESQATAGVVPALRMVRKCSMQCKYDDLQTLPPCQTH